MRLALLLLSLNALALEVERPVFNPRLELVIIRVVPDEFGTYALTNHNYREMTLTCANNVAYDRNKEPFIEYRNFYNEIAGRFTFEDDAICQDLGRFIESTGAGVTSEKPFRFTLNKHSRKVEKIVYPKLDEFADDDGEAPVLSPAKVQHH